VVIDGRTYDAVDPEDDNPLRIGEETIAYWNNPDDKGNLTDVQLMTADLLSKNSHFYHYDSVTEDLDTYHGRLPVQVVPVGRPSSDDLQGNTIRHLLIKIKGERSDET
jgi:hypothetical protein